MHSLHFLGTRTSIFVSDQCFYKFPFVSDGSTQAEVFRARVNLTGHTSSGDNMQDADVATDSEDDEVYEQNLSMVRKHTGMDTVLRSSIAHCSPEGNQPLFLLSGSTKVPSFRPNPSLIPRLPQFLTQSLTKNISSVSFPLPSSCRLLIGSPRILVFPDPVSLRQVAKQIKYGLPGPARTCSWSRSSRVTKESQCAHRSRSFARLVSSSLLLSLKTSSSTRNFLTYSIDPCAHFCSFKTSCLSHPFLISDLWIPSKHLQTVCI